MRSLAAGGAVLTLLASGAMAQTPYAVMGGPPAGASVCPEGLCGAEGLSGLFEALEERGERAGIKPEPLPDRLDGLAVLLPLQGGVDGVVPLGARHIPRRLGAVPDRKRVGRGVLAAAGGLGRGVGGGGDPAHVRAEPP